MKPNPSMAASASQVERLDAALAALRFARNALNAAEEEAAKAARSVFTPAPQDYNRTAEPPLENRFVDSTHTLWEIMAERATLVGRDQQYRWTFAEVTPIIVAAKPQPTLDKT